MEQRSSLMVCLDLSNIDNLLLGYLKFLSKMLNVRSIEVVHVVENIQWDSELLDEFPDIDDNQDIEDAILDELNQRVKKHFSNSDTEINIQLLHGLPTQCILKALNTSDAELLMLGKKTQYQGQGILSRKIARFAHVPVLFVPETVIYSLNTILVPINFTEPSARAIRYASVLAQKSNSKVLLQHVYDYPRQYFPFIPDDKYIVRMEKHLEKKYHKFCQKYNLPDLPCHFTPNKEAKTEDEIYDFSVQHQVDMIISGARSKTDTAALLIEEPAEHMANYNYRVPLLIYKDKAENEGFLKLLLDQLS